MHREFELRDSRAKKWNIAGYEGAPALDGAARGRERGERKAGEGAAQGERSVLGERGGVGRGAGGGRQGGSGGPGGIEQEEKTDEVSRPLDW